MRTGGRGLLLNNGVAQMASGVGRARCGRDLERVKKCGGFIMAWWFDWLAWARG